MNTARARMVTEPEGALPLVIRMLVKPQAAMAALKAVNWRWWGIAAFLIIAVTIGTVVAYSYADCQYIYQLQADHFNSSSQGGRPPEVPTPLPITMAIRAIGRMASTVLAWAGWSGALFLVVILLGHNGIGFGSVWTLVIWAWMPYVVRGSVQTVYMLAVGRPVYNQGLSGLVVDNTPPPPMTFEYVIPTASQQAMASLLSRIDVYVVWQLALLVVGTMALTSLTRRKATAVVVGIWLVLTLVTLVPSFFPGTFGRFRYF